MRASKFPSRIQHVTHSERGQMLILFVAIFSVILMMGAFALDQGLAYGKHGLAQGNADSASRAGAYGCVVSMSVDGVSPSNACNSDAELEAQKNATENQVSAGDVKTGPSPLGGNNSCPGDNSNDFPSMTVEVDKTSPSLFSKLWRLGDFTAKSIATTCVGAVSEVRPTNSLDEIPVWFSDTYNSNDPNDNYCGDPSRDDVAGEPCVIYSTHGGALDSAGLFTRGNGNSTCGPTNDGGVVAGIEGGLTGYDCSVGLRIDDESVNDNSVLDAFENRLTGADTCSNSSLSRTAFSATMNAVGNLANDGPDFVLDKSQYPTNADDDEDWTVYQQRGCASPRLVLVPLVDSTGSRHKRIVGFTALYILGCYPDSDGRSATTTMNDCGTNDRGSNDNGPCQHYDNHHPPRCTDDTDTEVRAGVVRIYLAGDSIQTIGEFSSSNHEMLRDIGAMAIQTTQ